MVVQNNNNDKITFSSDVEVFDASPDKLTQFKGDELIGGVSQGTVANNAKPDITRPIQSPNFKSGTTGWRLNSNGILEANGAIIT